MGFTNDGKRFLTRDRKLFGPWVPELFLFKLNFGAKNEKCFSKIKKIQKLAQCLKVS